jgi:hypothetical protein
VRLSFQHIIAMEVQGERGKGRDEKIKKEKECEKRKI